MAVKFDGTSAPYRFQEETTWCTGSAGGALTSRGFGSCVGLVLWCPSTKVGAVAHFSGSLGEASHQQTARDDAAEILLAMRSASIDAWDAWVFGGTSLATTSSSMSGVDALDLKTSTTGQTGTLIDIVRKALDDDSNFVFTHRIAGYEGHSAVKLDLATGKVTFS